MSDSWTDKKLNPYFMNQGFPVELNNGVLISHLLKKKKRVYILCKEFNKSLWSIALQFYNIGLFKSDIIQDL